MKINNKQILKVANRMTRRAFVSWTGLGWLISVLLGLVGTRTSEAQSGEDFRSVGNLTQLKQGNGLLRTKLKQTPVVVIRDSNQQNTLVALNPTCTHLGCQVNWQGEAKQFVCPCHNSKFSPTGSVLKGPAKKALPRYIVRVQGQSILVKLS